MKILDLYENICIIKVSKIKKTKTYFSRNKVKRLSEILPNYTIFDYIINNNAVKIHGQIPKEISDKLMKEFGLHVEHSKISNSSVILPFW